MFKTIEGIRVNGGSPGQLFGGGIYNASCSLGFSGNPTKITLNLVAENSAVIKNAVNNNRLDVTSGGYYDIQIGSQTFSNMMMFAYNFSDTPTSKTATVSFADWSIALDKIFVGLAGRHDTSSDGVAHQRVSECRFKVVCEQCNSLTPMRLIIPDALGQTVWNSLHNHGSGEYQFIDEAFYESAEVADIALNGAKVSRLQNIAGPTSWAGMADPGFYLSENLQAGNPLTVVDGGYIILGREKFPETNCEIPKVSYNFDDLCNIFDYIMNGQHNLRDFLGRATLETANAAYEASYTGTLREVLSAWASDLSFDYVVDSTRGTLPYLECFDLVNPINIGTVQNLIYTKFGNTTASADGGHVRSIQIGSSLENTYVQTPLVKYIKPQRTVDRESRHDEEKVAKVVRVVDAVGTAAHLGRSDSELMISIALAKYNSDARLLWLSHRAGNHKIDTDGDGVGDYINSGAFLALGFLPVTEIGKPDAAGNVDARELKAKWETIYSMRLQAPGDTKSINHPVWSDPTMYKLYIGIYNKQAQEAIGRFDEELSEFLGSYGYFDQAVPPNVFDCPDFHEPKTNNTYGLHRYSVQLNTLPESKMYSGHGYPFKNILRSNGGQFELNTNGDPRNVFKIEDNAWGTAQENVDWALENPYLVLNANQATFPGVDWASAVRHSDIDNYVPIYAYFDNNRVLNNYFTKHFPNWEQGASALFDKNDWASGYMPGFALIPDLDRATGISGRPILKVDWVEQQVLDVNGDPIPILDNNGNPLDPDGDGTPEYEMELKLEPNPVVFSNARRRRLEHFENGLTKDECKTYCEENIVKEICECKPYEEPYHGFYDVAHNAPVLTLTHLNRTVKVIFPIASEYKGYFSSKSQLRETVRAIQEVEGSPSDPVGFLQELRTKPTPEAFRRSKHNLPAGQDPANVMATRIVEIDATPEIEALQESVGVYANTVMATSPDGDTYNLYDLSTYYKFHRETVLSAPNPTETMNVRIDGTEYGSLTTGGVGGASLLSPAYGLTNFNISLDSDGVITDLTYSSRPPKLPKRDVMIQKLGPRFLDGRLTRPPLQDTRLF